jgi:hypothetical protein
LERHASVVASQLPHEICPPQPSLAAPHWYPAGHDVFFWQTPQTLAVPPPPQVSSAPVQEPQSSIPPQPSDILPHWPAWQVFGVQHWFL